MRRKTTIMMRVRARRSRNGYGKIQPRIAHLCSCCFANPKSSVVAGGGCIGRLGSFEGTLSKGFGGESGGQERLEQRTGRVVSGYCKGVPSRHWPLRDVLQPVETPSRRCGLGGVYDSSSRTGYCDGTCSGSSGRSFLDQWQRILRTRVIWRRYS